MRYGTEYDMLKNRFTKSQLVPCPENILNYEKTIVSAGVKEIMVHEAAGYGIVGSLIISKNYTFPHNFKIIYQEKHL
ncbi:Uncharacterized protein FWK35_00017180 [Aphis craccivora]|uniref:Uncharacterized protein n=1 Tax=Aphis craccivora TaxID=307492 RepID=A0A6G0Y9T7_APHCR|nr:Uncharacterized protein FWK35_00017180 [Aphis craccivora]